MARFKDAELILRVAEHWKTQCLLDQGSLFTQRSLWTRENFEEFRQLYVDRPLVGQESFLWKLEQQLAPGSKRIACLWAEMDWLYRLIVSRSAQGPEKKRNSIRHIWQWSGEDFPEKHDLLSDQVLGAGVLRPGRAFYRAPRKINFEHVRRQPGKGLQDRFPMRYCIRHVDSLKRHRKPGENRWHKRAVADN